MNKHSRSKAPKPYPEYAPGGFFDMETYRGNLRSVVFWIVVTTFIWYFEEAYALAHHLLGFSYEINRAKQGWTRLWGGVLGVVGLLSSSICLLRVFRRRRKTKLAARDSN